MKKNVHLFIVCFMLTGWLFQSVQAQVLLSEDFESGEFPADWFEINVDGLSPALDDDASWADTAWIVGASSTFTGYAIISISWYQDDNGNDVGPADDWLITPKVNILSGTTLNFDAKSATSSGDFPDDYWVLINTGEPTKESFEADGEVLLMVDDEDYEDFRNVEIDLSSYEGQDVHIAFRNVTNTDGYGLWLDQISISATDVSTQEIDASYFQLRVGPNPAQDVTMLQYQLPQRSEVAIVVQDATGNTLFREDLGTQILGDYSYELPLSQYAPGTYLVSVQTPEKISATQLLIAR